MDIEKKIEIINKARQIHILLSEISDLIEDGDANIWTDIRMAQNAVRLINNKMIAEEVD